MAGGHRDSGIKELDIHREGSDGRHGFRESADSGFASLAFLTLCVCCITCIGSWAMHLQRMPLFCCPAFHGVHVARVRHSALCPHGPGCHFATFARDMPFAACYSITTLFGF